MEKAYLLSEEVIRQLLKIGTESKNLDYKQAFNWDTYSKDDKHEIVKDILAMANTLDGGKIVFGVQDSDFGPVGLKKEDFESFDTTKINDLLHNFTEPKHSCQVYKQTIDGKYFVVIDIPEFREVPIICKNDAFSLMGAPRKQILRRGQIYIRTEKASTEQVCSVEEMRALLGNALTKKGDELLNNVRRLMVGKPLQTSNESEQSYAEEIKECDSFISDKLGGELKKFGYWEICAYPTNFNPQRIPEQKQLRELIEKVQVRQRGWYFPHTDQSGKNNSNFNSGWQSFTIDSEDIQPRAIEAFRAYQSGLFAFKKALWDDTSGRSINGKSVLSISDSIWSITEFFLFLKRYYEEIVPEEDVHVSILLNGTKDRIINFHDLYFRQIREHISNEEILKIADRDIKVIDLKASYKTIANEACRKLLAVFNWDDVTEKYVDDWQTQLIEKRFERRF